MLDKKNSTYHQNPAVEAFDDFIILLTLNIKKELGFFFVGDENSTERQFADYLKMELQEEPKIYTSIQDKKRNTYYNSLQMNMQKQIDKQIELANNTAINTKESLIFGAASLTALFCPGTTIPSAIAMTVLLSAAARLVYRHLKRQEALLIKEYLIEENQPVIELVILLFTLYSVEKLNRELFQIHSLGLLNDKFKFSQLMKKLQNIITNKDPLYDKDPLEDLDDNLKRIDSMAKKDSLSLMQNLVKQEKDRKTPCPHAIYDRLSPEFLTPEAFLSTEFLIKQRSLRHWLGVLEKTIEKNNNATDLIIFAEKLPLLYKKTAHTMISIQKSLEHELALEKQDMKKQFPVSYNSSSSIDHQAPQRGTVFCNQYFFSPPQNDKRNEYRINVNRGYR